MLKAVFVSFTAVSTVAACPKIEANPVVNRSSSKVLVAQTQAQSTKPSNAGRLFKAAARIIGNQRHKISSEMMLTGETPGMGVARSIILP